jgi:carbonic anhydrase/acetyltransferase-like protein (isoleucine patch superfamily)
MNNIAILEHDNIFIRDGDNKIKLFRIIATKGIMVKIPTVDKGTKLLIWEDYFVEKHSIGGYVENINQLEGSSWLDGHAKVWGNAKIINAFIADTAKIYGNAIVENSYVANLAVITNNAKVTNSWISDQAVIKQNAVVEESKIFNSAMMFGNARVSNSNISGGCYVMKDAVVEGCTLRDTAMVGGTAHVKNCILSNRSAFTEGFHQSKNIDFDVELKSVIPDRFYDVDF